MREPKKDHPKYYKLGLKSTPDPDSLQEVDFEKLREEHGDNYNFDTAGKIMDENLAVIEGWNDKAVKDRAWVGRTLSDSMADGYAVYVVIRENKKSVRIRVCRGIGDDWVSRHWGEEHTIDKIEALDFMDHGGIFSKKVPYPYDIVMTS